ncbi:MAG TPA: CoA-binding protein [Thermoanaerobaculia bacterium]|nr:CoA-binding protein [Thermoanaerobaculia bacterium]
MSSPRTIAVLGASSNRRKYGNKCVRAYQAAGYRVYPVNPHETEVEGLRAVPRLAEVPEPLERISVYLQPEVTLQVLPEIASAGAGEVWFNPGSADEQVVEEARRRGLPARHGCSIVDVGYSPSQFPA